MSTNTEFTENGVRLSIYLSIYSVLVNSPPPAAISPPPAAISPPPAAVSPPRRHLLRQHVLLAAVHPGAAAGGGRQADGGDTDQR
eukprot:1180806-Prorocentrum_minimum.AAC.2